MTLNVFISYAKEDEPHASHYYDLLKTERGISPWLDIKKLLPGQNWEAEIDRAFKEAHVIILLISKKSVDKRGFVQKEFNDAIEQLRYKKPTDIYILPLLIESCNVPSYIGSRLQYIDLNVGGAWEQVKESLKLASEQQSVVLEKGLELGLFTVFTEKFEERWAGLPGHDISIDYPRFESASNAVFARELSNYFFSRAFSILVQERQKPWQQSPEFFEKSFIELASNGRWESFNIEHVTTNFFSLNYSVGWYGAGAAHPNSHFETYNFVYIDRLYLLNIYDFFVDMEAALKIISKKCISELSKIYWERTGEKPESDQIKWFEEGAGEDLKNFHSFTINENYFTFLFPPYQVSSYSMGTWTANVSIFEVLELLNDNVISLILGKKF